MDTPYSLIRLDRTHSTQEVARLEFSGSPLLVVADRQTAGRGRSGAAWLTAPVALAASLVFRHRGHATTTIPLTAGVAAIRAVTGIPGGHPPAQLKWPNDLVVGDDKVGGILSEAVGEVVVVGLGLNLWWPDPPAGMAALFADRPPSTTTQEMGERWAGELLGLLSADDWPLGEYRRMCGTVGQSITWEPGGSGMAVGVANDGGLIVESGGETLVLRSGAVRHVRRADGSGRRHC